MNYLNKKELFFISNGEVFWYKDIPAYYYKDRKTQNIIYKLGIDKENFKKVIFIFVKINLLLFYNPEYKISFEFFFIHKLFGVLEMRIQCCNLFESYIYKLVTQPYQ